MLASYQANEQGDAGQSTSSHTFKIYPQITD